MTNWTFFATLTQQLLALMQAGTAAMTNGSLGYVRPAVLIGITAWLAFQAICVANGIAPMRSLWHGLLRGAIVLFLLQAANYTQYISGLAQVLPTEAGNALAAGGANAGNVTNGAAFDGVWNAAAKAGLMVWEAVPRYSLSSIPLWFAIIIYLAIALVAIGFSWLIYLASTVLLALLLAVGPLFLALFAFPQTHKFAAGWTAALASTIVTQILTVAILVMFVGVETATVQRITAGAGAAVVDNFINAIITLAEGALLMWLIGMLVKQAPSLAQGIAGGVYQSVGGMLASAAAGTAAAGRAATAGVALGARGVSAAAREAGAKVASAARVSRPTGRSLSIRDESFNGD